MTQCPVPESPRPDEEGWVRRTVADRTRVEELAETYRGLGFETRVIALAADRFGDGCSACAASGTCVALFTRQGVATDAARRSPVTGAR